MVVLQNANVICGGGEGLRAKHLAFAFSVTTIFDESQNLTRKSKITMSGPKNVLNIFITSKCII